MQDPLLSRVVDALRPVKGLSALVLGGSRGRGTAGPQSDYDLGLYYEPDAPFDVEALRSAIAPLVDDPSSTVTRFGEWGPWINGGGWLTIGGSEFRQVGASRLRQGGSSQGVQHSSVLGRPLDGSRLTPAT
jgi:hypothetical protein